MIIARNLTRTYGDVRAVSDVSFEIAKGEVVGLLGHNGAGKTTIMKMLTGFLEPDSGSISVDGIDIETDRAAVQDAIGYLPENCPVYPEMTVMEYLSYVGELRGLSGDALANAIRRAIRDTDLSAKATAQIDTLSRGYRQRVGVAQAILHDPRILILDEPTNGLDPSQIHHMRDLIRRLAKTATVIVSTHILQEVQAVCDRAIVIHRGRKALDASLSDLRDAGRLLVTVDAAPDDGLPAFKSLDEIVGVEHIEAHGEKHRYALSVNGAGLDGTAPIVADAVHSKGFKLFALEREQRDLERIFAEINGPGSSAPSTKEVGHA